MSMGEMSPADIAALTGNNNNNRSNDGFGNDMGAWWIIIFVLFFAFGGWGNGFGNRNGNGNGNGGCDVNILPVNGGFGGFGGYNACCTPATQQGMTDAFNFAKLDNITSAINTGICDSTYALNNAINGVNANISDCCCKNQTTMLQGFNGVDRSLCSGFNSVNSGINNLGFNLQQCCCDLGKEIIESRNQAYRNTCDIINAGHADTQRVIDQMTQNEIQTLRTELQSAQLQLSNNAQTQTLINTLQPTSRPCYLTCSPYESAYYGYRNNGYGCNNGCGCNSGCCC